MRAFLSQLRRQMKYKTNLLRILSTVLILAIASICCCACGNSAGRFYTLREAYESGLLTSRDIMDIAYYYRDVTMDGGLDDDIRENYTPTPKSPEKLSDRTVTTIKKTYRRDILKRNTATLKKISVGYYYGTYGDCIVVSVTDRFAFYDYQFDDDYYIAGIHINWYCPNFLRVWIK